MRRLVGGLRAWLEPCVQGDPHHASTSTSGVGVRTRRPDCDRRVASSSFEVGADRRHGAADVLDEVAVDGDDAGATLWPQRGDDAGPRAHRCGRIAGVPAVATLRSPRRQGCRLRGRAVLELGALELGRERVDRLPRARHGCGRHGRASLAPMPVSYDDPAVQTHNVCPGQDGCFPAYLTGIVSNPELPKLIQSVYGIPA